jgi:4'-phosphopantetheinyl transferase
MRVEFQELAKQEFKWEQAATFDCRGEAHVWGIALKEVWRQEEKFLRALPKDEVEEVRRFRYQEDQLRKLGSRWWRRYLLGRYLQSPMEDLQFVERAGGKWALAQRSGIHFNVAHAGEWIFIVISDQECGIDVEEERKILHFRPLAESVFHEEEMADWEKEAFSMTYFYQIWTRKEALLKALGLGLDADLANINCGKDALIWHRNGGAEKVEFKNVNFYPDELHIGCVQYQKGLKLKFYRGLDSNF